MTGTTHACQSLICFFAYGQPYLKYHTHAHRFIGIQSFDAEKILYIIKFIYTELYLLRKLKIDKAVSTTNQQKAKTLRCSVHFDLDFSNLISFSRKLSYSTLSFPMTIKKRLFLKVSMRYTVKRTSEREDTTSRIAKWTHNDPMRAKPAAAQARRITICLVLAPQPICCTANPSHTQLFRW